MARTRKTWVYQPPRPPAPRLPADLKDKVQERANIFVDTLLKPKNVKPAPINPQSNYLVDIYTKWYRHYFYFCAKYRACGPNATTPYFEVKFARLEYIGDESFNLSFLRHTGQWVELYQNLTLDECLESIDKDPFFIP